MELKQYQKRAVDSLLVQAKQLLARGGSRIAVLKAPTGSGKTIMVADFLEQLSQGDLPGRYSFLWISGNNLHEQSHDKLSRYLGDSRYRLSYLDDIQEMELAENEIVFVNWHSLTKRDRQSGEYLNTYMKEQEDGRTLQNFIANTKANGKEIILIVDESHYHYWSLETPDFVQNIIGPKLTIEVSATPKIVPTLDEVASMEKGYISVSFEDVVNEGMIKSSVVINESLGEQAELLGTDDQLIIDAAILKRDILLDEYRKAGSDVKPLVLVQLPSDQKDMTDLDEGKRDFLISYLRKAHSITTDNGRLAIWLSNEKKNIEGIAENDSPAEVLIFKQAVALGWDCPRAHILVMFRDIKSVTFEIQTVGRILRMPESKHYGNSELDRAYTYTNLDRVLIADNKADRGYFQTKRSVRAGSYSPISIPSIYQSRIDYGDLTGAFHSSFYEAANSYFGIVEADMSDEALRKADLKLELTPQELTRPVVVDAIIENIDKGNQLAIGASELQMTVAESDIKLLFTLFAKASSLPYAPVRSHTKIQQSIYNWFDSYLGYKGRSRLDIQRVVVCSEANLKIFRQIIEEAKQRFRLADEQQRELRRKIQINTQWNPPAYDYFSDSYQEAPAANSLMQPFYLEPSPSEPEKEFIEAAKKSADVLWWYRNGSNKETYLGIAYRNSLTDRQDTFYPDFIVKYQDGRIGIYDTKKGMTAQSDDTADKSNALHAYLQENSKEGKQLVGGIIDVRPSGFFLFTEAEYSKDPNHPGWQRLIV